MSAAAAGLPTLPRATGAQRQWQPLAAGVKMHDGWFFSLATV